ncbi:hypothetical protein BJ878DRAFT_500343 [Calycina marina]|uniref:VWFA domain-containing protein n=1 Tax=Calycina marina TaxID=1763456 RepID=A0A9P8CHP6_9HELO|nr:hypothetical protein BJ878DRAFT_500343 [Calycina marina]
MPSNSPFIVEPVSAPSRSFFGSIKKLGRKGSNLSTNWASSTKSNASSRSIESATQQPRRAAELTPSTAANIGNPFSSSSEAPPTRPSDRPGMNDFTTPSNEPPPAYSPSPSMTTNNPLSELPAEPESTLAAASGSEDPYTFLSNFDTILVIDDSGSMAGRSWREVSQALAIVAPIVAKHDADGMDLYFLNHKSHDGGVPSEGVAPSGYRGIKRAEVVSEIFNRIRPAGGTPTGTRLQSILRSYLAQLDKVMKDGKEMKPINIIVLTDGVPSDDVESVLISAAKKLDRLDAPPTQVGVQFFQVGNEEGAKEALEELDDELGNLVEGGIRDIVDTVTWTGGISTSNGGVGLTGDSILKVLLGSVVRRLDRRRASGDVRRQAGSSRP